jgi:DNA uptake protein ComE-like DNA-binding protein
MARFWRKEMARKGKSCLNHVAARWMGTFTVGVMLLWLTSCNTKQPSNEQLQQQAAQTTQQVKQGAQQAAADAKVAAANAESKVNAIAAGVKEGLKSGKPAAGVVNINSAPEEQLVDLPGISGARAQRIIRGRPYDNPQDLVSKGILTKEQYQRISSQVTAN